MTYRDLLLKPPDDSSAEEGWIHLSDELEQSQYPIDSGAQEFLTSHPIDRRLFYRMLPWRGKVIAWYLLRTGRGRHLIPEVLLAQNLLRAESADDLKYTMLCYTLERDEGGSLMGRVFGLRCSACSLNALIQGSFAKDSRAKITSHVTAAKHVMPDQRRAHLDPHRDDTPRLT